MFLSFRMGKTSSERVFLIVFSLVLLTLIPIFLLDNVPLSLYFPKKPEKCDIFNGTWTLSEGGGPYYTNSTCKEIPDAQNCIKFGRPDTEFLKWKWKPNECELPGFDAYQFLELVRGKSMAFLGDSVARNQRQSLVCMLSAVAYPEAITTNNYNFKSWFYADYNFTLSTFWAPYLAKLQAAHPGKRAMNLYLDEPDYAWGSDIENFDYVIVSAGQWFFQPLVFYENGQVIGCYMCNENNMTKIDKYYGYRMAFRTTFKFLQSLENYKGMTILRTFSPAHFENGYWNSGGNCARTKPFTREERTIDPWKLEFYYIQTEEYRAAEMQGRNKGLKFSILDTTAAMMLRSDGHPNHYGHARDSNVTNADCTHWCLPGPIDTWNEFLLHLLKIGGVKQQLTQYTRKQQEKFR